MEQRKKSWFPDWNQTHGLPKHQAATLSSELQELIENKVIFPQKILKFRFLEMLLSTFSRQYLGLKNNQN